MSSFLRGSIWSSVEGPFFTPEERDAYMRHVDMPVRVRFVTLWAPFEVTRERSLGDPHPERITWQDPAWLRERYDESATLLEAVRGTDTLVDTEGLSAHDAAERIAGEIGITSSDVP